jgi:hypothetical protein
LLNRLPGTASPSYLRRVGWLSSLIAAVRVFWCGCDGNLNVSTLLETHIIRCQVIADATVFTKNRDRLLQAEVAKEFLARVVAQARPVLSLVDPRATGRILVSRSATATANRPARC